MQWVVIMYSLKDKKIADYESCESEEDACEYLDRTSKDKYKEECDKYGINNVHYEKVDTNNVRLATTGGEWTWEIIPVY